MFLHLGGNTTGEQGQKFNCYHHETHLHLFPEQKCEHWMKPGSKFFDSEVFIEGTLDISLESLDIRTRSKSEKTVSSPKNPLSPCFY